MIYLSYILGNIAILIAAGSEAGRRKGAPFKLGSWGMIINVLGLVWGISMFVFVNFLWPRAQQPSSEQACEPAESRSPSATYRCSKQPLE